LFDIRIDGVEVSDQGSDGGIVRPTADGVGPQGDFHAVGQSEGGNHQHHAQEQSEQLLHGWVPPLILVGVFSPDRERTLLA